MRKLLSLFVVVLLAALAPVACDLQKTGNQLQSERVMVATILATPPIDLSPEALAGFDGGFDAGMLQGNDAGISFDGGMVTIPPQTVAFVFFGEMDRTSLDEPPTPLEGATVTVGAEGETGVTLEEKGEGNYEATSATNEALSYTSGATYLFTVVHEGETYVGKVEDVPQLERIEDLHPPKGFIEQTANTPFTFTRPEPAAGQERNLGFVTVFPVSEDGERGDPTYTNIPSTPLDFLLLAAKPSKWKTDSITVPGSAFPEADKTYVLVMQAVKLGGPESDNLFSTSALLAGTAEVGIFRTK